MNIVDDIKPLSFFKQKTTDVIKHIKKTKKPTFITINGNVELVVQDAESYQKTLDYIQSMNDVSKIQKGLDDVKNGKFVSLEDGFSKLKKKHNF